ncbi:transposase [Streptomyces sp. NPDC006197]|uniref:transposase n=1 Tax=Streptomyces sp. NPDC006197 TaxID=3156685 RepID=UPI00339FAEFF
MGTARYSEEFKRDAVALVESSGRRIGSAVRELGVDPESLRRWGARSRAEAAAGGESPLNPAEREELRHCGACASRSVSWGGRFCGRRPRISPRRGVDDRPLSLFRPAVADCALDGSAERRSSW